MANNFSALKSQNEACNRPPHTIREATDAEKRVLRAVLCHAYSAHFALHNDMSFDLLDDFPNGLFGTDPVAVEVAERLEAFIETMEHVIAVFKEDITLLKVAETKSIDDIERLIGCELPDYVWFRSYPGEHEDGDFDEDLEAFKAEVERELNPVPKPAPAKAATRKRKVA